MKQINLKLFVLGILGIALISNSYAQNQKPNIIFILADDFGYTSLNCYGAEKSLVRTPYIDRIAEKGMKFTNAYTAASVCTPTRYSFIMGEYPWRSKLKYGVWGVESPLLPDPDKETIADWLKERGYNTAAIGKWHLGYGKTGKLIEYTGTLKPGPLDLGFDYHFGVPQNHGDKMGVFIENDHIYGIRSDKIQPYSRTFYSPQYYGFDAPQRKNIETMEDLTDKTLEWLSLQSSETPFFLYFAPVAVHHPITPSNYMRGMSDCGAYGDFIQDLDWSVGRIIQTLEYKGLLENSIVIFTSDNGGEIPGSRPEAPEIQAINAGLKINGDLRGDKHTIWEGGTRVPFIVSWPGRVDEGSVSEDIIAVMDVFATIADITGNGLPEDKNVAPDSYSFISSLVGESNNSARTSVVTADMNGMQAIRMGEWKLIDNTLPEELPESRRARLNSLLKPQLYNLSEDPAESANVYDRYPKIVKKLTEELDRIRAEESSR
ncbi:sulfatase-like hydrolase/transferase [Bacteroidota bacterium]